MCFVAVAGENLLKNADFEKGSTRWSGDRKIVSEGDNKICKVELEEDESVSFCQKIALQDPKDLILRFKIRKSDDYEGDEEVLIRFDEERSAMHTSRMIPDNHEWNEIEFHYTNYRDAKRIEIIFMVNRGAGTLYFDDIELTEKD